MITDGHGLYILLVLACTDSASFGFSFCISIASANEGETIHNNIQIVLAILGE